MEKQEKTTIKIDPETATEFKTFARKWGISYSNTLQLMLDFFKRNRMSPTEDLRPNMKSLEHRLSLQIDALRAILLNIETKKIRPTHAMLERLFQSHSSKTGILLEKKEHRPTQHPPTKSLLSTSDSCEDNRHQNTLRTIQKLFNHAEITKGHQDKVQLRITLSSAEFQQLQKNLKRTSHVS